MRKIQIDIIIFISVYQIEIKCERQLRPATETSWVVSYGVETIPRWRTAAILKIVISPYLSETRGQSNLTKSASRGPIPRLGVTPGGRKLYH